MLIQRQLTFVVALKGGVGWNALAFLSGGLSERSFALPSDDDDAYDPERSEESGK